jgi:hypothetical protein
MHNSKPNKEEECAMTSGLTAYVALYQRDNC